MVDFVALSVGETSSALAEWLIGRDLTGRLLVTAVAAMRVAQLVDEPGPNDRVDTLALALDKLLKELGDDVDDDAPEFFASISTPVPAEVRDAAESEPIDSGAGGGGGGSEAGS